jgi:hypothetical protein
MVVVAREDLVVNEADQVRIQQTAPVKAETLTALEEHLVEVAEDLVPAGQVQQVVEVAVPCVLSGVRDVHSRRPMLEL